MKTVGIKIKALCKNTYFLYLVLFIISSLIIFFPFIKSGRFLIWYSAKGKDGLWQHLNAFSYYGKYWRDFLKRIFVNHQPALPLYDFSLGFGADIITTLQYYVFGDPFALISIFFPVKYSDIGFTVSIFARLFFAGFFFIKFLQYKKCNTKISVAAAIIYTFSTLALVGLRHPYFLNPFVYIPLITFGMEKAVKEKKSALYIFSIFIAGMSNFYFFYMLIVYAFFMAIIFSIDSEKGERLLVFLKLALFSVIGILMACILLYPTALAFLDSSRASSGNEMLLLYPKEVFYLMMQNLIVPNESFRWGYMGLSPIALLGVLIAFLTHNGDKKYRRAFVLFFILFLLPIGSQLMNGFSIIYGRWLFILIFLSCFLFAENILKIQALSHLEKIIVFSIVWLYSVFIFMTSKESDRHEVIISLIVLFISLFVILFLKKRFLILGVFLIGIIGTLVNGYEKYTYEEYYKEFNGSSKALLGGINDTINKIDDDEFFRVELGRNELSQTNPALVSNQNVTVVHWSLLSKYISNYLSNINNYEREVSNYRTLESRAMVLPLFSAKYYVGKDSYHYEVPYGYTFYKDGEDGFKIYQTKNSLPLGFTYDKYIKYSEYEKMSPIIRQEIMLSNVVIPDEMEQSGELKEVERDSFREKSTSKEINVRIAAGKDTDIEGNKIIVHKKNGRLTLFMDESSPRNSELYLVVNGLHYEGKRSYVMMRAFCNNAMSDPMRYFTEEHNFYSGRENYVFNLFYSNRERGTISLSLSKPGVYSIDSMYAVVESMDSLSEKVSKLNEEHLKNIKIYTNKISGDIDVSKEKILCFSIPYSDGFHLKIDGKEEKLYNVNDAFMGCKVSAGHHEIELTYFTPGLLTGIFMSVIGFIIFFVLMKREKR